MAGDFKVNFGALDTAAMDIQGAGKNLAARLQQLDQSLAPLRSDWTGAASESYAQSKAKWTRSIEEMQILLSDIGRAVQASGGGYNDAEKRNSGLFG
ncbi:MAG: WXG100 family type VII secretion target [Sporichthyaceae bacterium]